MKKHLNALYRAVLNDDPETRQLIRFLHRYCGGPGDGLRILDVGCGYGRNLRSMIDAGFRPLGVDINPGIVAANRANGLDCVVAGDLAADAEPFDVLLMSHVIEHFAPGELKEFIDSHLDRLRVGGHLIIATPMMTRHFYDDFDHVKPYHAEGIGMVFGDEQNAQTQYYSRNKLALRDIWFRTGYYKLRFTRLRYSPSPLAVRTLQLLDFSSALAWRLSFRKIGFLSGWVGVFERTR
jgi:SAM-dependent methyltransferase